MQNNFTWYLKFHAGGPTIFSQVQRPSKNLYIYISYDIYILHRKYQVKPHSSPWFSAVSAAAIVHRNHFFRLYQQNKSSESKVQFRQVSNHCQRVLEAVKLTYANKTKESITSQKLDTRDFWRIVNSVLNRSIRFLFYEQLHFWVQARVAKGFPCFQPQSCL